MIVQHVDAFDITEVIDTSARKQNNHSANTQHKRNTSRSLNGSEFSRTINGFFSFSGAISWKKYPFSSRKKL